MSDQTINSAPEQPETNKEKRARTARETLDKELGSVVMRRGFVNGMLRWGHLHGGQKRAAIFAGYSEHTASSTAHQLMQKPEILEAIQAGMDARADRCKVSPDKVLNAIAAIAFADVAEIMTWEKNKVTLRDLNQLLPHESAGIHSVTETKIKGGGTKLEVKTHDQLKALELLGKTMAMFRDKVDDPSKQIGGVLRVPNRPSIQQWEEEEGITEAGAAQENLIDTVDLEEEP